jgi:hypothetical protein
MTAAQSVWRYPYGTRQHYHLKDVHLFASGIEELYERMKAAGLHIPNPIRKLGGGGGYFMLGAPDGVAIEIFEPGPCANPSCAIITALADRLADFRGIRG